MVAQQHSGAPAGPSINARVFQRVLKWLSPWEAALMHLQSLLVWERTRPSLVFTASIHSFFWYVALSKHGSYFVICFGLLILVLLDLWKGYIWPEIKVPDEFDREESWVPIHARLLSVHDISLIAAQEWAKWSTRLDSLWALRRKRPLFFCILLSVFWLTTAYLGSCIRGTALIYLAFVVAMTLPCLLYHGFLETFKLKALPIWHKIDRHLEAQARWEDPHDASIQEAQLCPNSASLRADIEKVMRDSNATALDSDDELLDFIPTEEVTSVGEEPFGFRAEDIAAELEGR